MSTSSRIGGANRCLLALAIHHDNKNRSQSLEAKNSISGVRHQIPRALPKRSKVTSSLAILSEFSICRCLMGRYVTLIRIDADA